MRFCFWAKDGGAESKVWGFWLIEWKRVCSVALLKFEDGSRDAFHSHAFNAVSWVLWGRLHELFLAGGSRAYRSSLRPVWTPHNRFHQVISLGTTWVFTIRGPWRDQWREYIPADQRFLTLTHGRQEM